MAPFVDKLCERAIGATLLYLPEAAEHGQFIVCHSHVGLDRVEEG